MKFKKFKQHSESVVVGSGKKSLKLFDNKNTLKDPPPPITKIEKGMMTGEINMGIVGKTKNKLQAFIESPKWLISAKKSQKKSLKSILLSKTIIGSILVLIIALSAFFYIKYRNTLTIEGPPIDKEKSQYEKDIDTMKETGQPLELPKPGITG